MMGDLDFSAILVGWPYLWSGLLFSLALTSAAFTMGMALGALFAIVQEAEVRVVAPIVRAYVVLIRSVPLILVLFWFFFLVPVALGELFGGGRPIPLGANLTAFVTFGLFEAAYYSEILRTGFRSIDRGQFEAATSLSLPRYRTYRHVILPQVIRAAGPIILTQTIVLFQDTSLVYVLSLTDLLGAAVKLAEVNGRIVELYLAVAVVYLAISSSASMLVSALGRRVAR